MCITAVHLMCSFTVSHHYLAITLNLANMELFVQINSYAFFYFFTMNLTVSISVWCIKANVVYTCYEITIVVNIYFPENKYIHLSSIFFLCHSNKSNRYKFTVNQNCKWIISFQAQHVIGNVRVITYLLLGR